MKERKKEKKNKTKATIIQFSRNLCDKIYFQELHQNRNVSHTYGPRL